VRLERVGRTEPPADLLPVGNVDWCDAAAFCAWAGKHICGSFTGVAEFVNTINWLDSRWSYVCTAGGLHLNLYGDKHVSGLCNNGSLQPVGSFPDCVSAEPEFAGVYDLIGNAGEWDEYSNEATTSYPPDQQLMHCRPSYWSTTTDGECKTQIGLKRSERKEFMGIRCCGG
jgi:formylglycine-generating enzyme